MNKQPTYYDQIKGNLLCVPRDTWKLMFTMQIANRIFYLMGEAVYEGLQQMDEKNDFVSKDSATAFFNELYDEFHTIYKNENKTCLEQEVVCAFMNYLYLQYGSNFENKYNVRAISELFDFDATIDLKTVKLAIKKIDIQQILIKTNDFAQELIEFNQVFAIKNKIQLFDNNTHEITTFNYSLKNKTNKKLAAEIEQMLEQHLDLVVDLNRGYAGTDEELINTFSIEELKIIFPKIGQREIKEYFGQFVEFDVEDKAVDWIFMEDSEYVFNFTKPRNEQGRIIKLDENELEVAELNGMELIKLLISNDFMTLFGSYFGIIKLDSYFKRYKKLAEWLIRYNLSWKSAPEELMIQIIKNLKQVNLKHRNINQFDKNIDEYITNALKNVKKTIIDFNLPRWFEQFNLYHTYIYEHEDFAQMSEAEFKLLNYLVFNYGTSHEIERIIHIINTNKKSITKNISLLNEKNYLIFEGENIKLNCEYMDKLIQNQK